MPNVQPNIVIIMCDQLRGDCLSIMGHPDVKTPYLDTLAAEGTLFTRTYSACPSCIPARAGFLTGRAPCSHGRVGNEESKPWEYDHMLAQEFSRAGYQTALLGKAHVFPPRLGCGFEVTRIHDGYLGRQRRASMPYWMNQNVYDDYLRFLRAELGPDADVNAAGVENNSWICRPWPYEERLHPTNWVVDESIRFLETRDRTRPFLMMTSFVRPHPPFDPPRDYLDMYRDCDLREPAEGDWDDREATEREGMKMDSFHGCRDARLRHDAMAGYYACVTHVDHQIGRLITALENDESWNDTIVVFTADHGEMLFDHGLFRKRLPYEGSAHVPLIIRVGKRVADTTPHRSESLVELMDVMPTLLDLAGLEVPSTVDGESIASDVLRGQELHREYVHGEHTAGDLTNHWIVTQSEKYVWYARSGKEQLFDLSSDPRETHDLSADPAWKPRLEELRTALIGELECREEGFVQEGRLVAGRPLKGTLEHTHPLRGAARDAVEGR